MGSVGGDAREGGPEYPLVLDPACEGACPKEQESEQGGKLLHDFPFIGQLLGQPGGLRGESRARAESRIWRNACSVLADPEGGEHGPVVGGPGGNHEVGIFPVFAHHLAREDLGPAGKHEIDAVVEILGVVRAGLVGPGVAAFLDFVGVDGPVAVGQPGLRYPRGGGIFDRDGYQARLARPGRPVLEGGLVEIPRQEDRSAFRIGRVRARKEGCRPGCPGTCGPIARLPWRW